MTDMRLGNLLIANFRSLRGTVALPFDAPIVLMHGSNGMGKTSVLSAIELALTGQIEYLQRTDRDYKKQLLHRGASEGSITLSTINNGQETPVKASLEINRATYRGLALFKGGDAKFFSERCYLPQETLGRLLELYQDANTDDKTSLLTRFVNELLGLDQLNALVEGLFAAFHIGRIRNLVPEYRRCEALLSEQDGEIQNRRLREEETRKEVKADRDIITRSLTDMYGRDNGLQQLIVKPTELQQRLAADSSEDRELVQLARTRQELAGLLQRWSELPKTVAAKERETQERAERRTRASLEKWRNGPGMRLAEIAKDLVDIFMNLPSPLSSDPTELRDILERDVVAERERCTILLNRSNAATTRINSLQQSIRQSETRIAEIDRELTTFAGDTEGLARALAGIVPHLHGENCPVCNRDYSELRKGPLAARLSASIASLTSQASRLKSLVADRAAEIGRKAQDERENMEVGKSQLNSASIANLTMRRARLEEALEKLYALRDAAAEGSALLRAQFVAKELVAQARRRDELDAEIRSDVARWTDLLSGNPVEAFETLGQAIDALLSTTKDRVNVLQIRQEQRRQLLNRLGHHMERLRVLASLEKSRDTLERERSTMRKAVQGVSSIREKAKQVSNAARAARTSIVGRVFNTALNAMWRDLFVRLAPYEQFVPAFRIPDAGQPAIEASLETVHRDGGSGGPPGTMLSAGNLNTAALTLFLALHLSVARRIPWLILDDPVQSMDDVHISQFAALLRTIARTFDRQIILAVHDRALFDYLTLELSPAFEDDRLITIELSKTIAGDSIATPRVFTFRPDKAIAA
jgi:exonuclease SbcC